MSQRYPGGFIFRSNPTIVGPTDGEGGSAPGVWTLEQASYYTKQETWPKPILQGGLYGWGFNQYGELGQNDTVSRSSPTQVGALTNWSKVTASAQQSALAVKGDGTLWGWGNNTFGQLGFSTSYGAARLSPTQVGALTTWSKVSCQAWNTLAIKTDGTLWAWGQNTSGNLGQNDRVNRSSPVQVGALTTWLNIVGGNYCSLATKTDGTLWAWGDATQGQLGLNDTVNRSSPVQVGALTNWAKIASGDRFILAAKTDGTLWSWGRNNKGQLGQIDLVYRSSPVQVGALTNWSLSAGGSDFSLAVKTDGTLWAWGNNVAGQLGQNNIINRSSPVQVGGLTSWAKVATTVSRDTATAIKTDGTLWTWGDNARGQLGQNIATTVVRSSPVQVGSNTNWNNIAGGFDFFVATTTS